MKLSRLTALAIASLALSATAVATSIAVDYFDSSSASFKVYKNADGMEVLEAVETRYFDLGYPTDFLAKATIETRRFTGAEGMQGNVKLEVRGTDKKRFDKVMWTAQEQGAEVVFPGTGFVGIREYGCCGASDITRLLNVNTGKKVEATTSTLFEIEVPNSMLPNRFLAVVLDSKAPAYSGTKSYIGTVSYFSNERIISRVRVYADLPVGWGTDLSELKLVSLAAGGPPIVNEEGTRATLWSSNGVRVADQAYKLFALTASVYYANSNETLHIEVSGDKIDQVASKASPGLELVFAK